MSKRIENNLSHSAYKTSEPNSGNLTIWLPFVFYRKNKPDNCEVTNMPVPTSRSYLQTWTDKNTRST